MKYICVEWMYTLYKFPFLNGITEINKLFDDILIIWPAPVYLRGTSGQFVPKRQDFCQGLFYRANVLQSYSTTERM